MGGKIILCFFSLSLPHLLHCCKMSLCSPIFLSVCIAAPSLVDNFDPVATSSPSNPPLRPFYPLQKERCVDLEGGEATPCLKVSNFCDHEKEGDCIYILPPSHPIRPSLSHLHIIHAMGEYDPLLGIVVFFVCVSFLSVFILCCMSLCRCSAYWEKYNGVFRNSPL